jgi:hypothetical protein
VLVLRREEIEKAERLLKRERRRSHGERRGDLLASLKPCEGQTAPEVGGLPERFLRPLVGGEWRGDWVVPFPFISIVGNGERPTVGCRFRFCTSLRLVARCAEPVRARSGRRPGARSCVLDAEPLAQGAAGERPRRFEHGEDSRVQCGLAVAGVLRRSIDELEVGINIALAAPTPSRAGRYP